MLLHLLYHIFPSYARCDSCFYVLIQIFSAFTLNFCHIYDIILKITDYDKGASGMGTIIDKIKALMKRSEERTELITDILCLLASYALIFMLPQRMSILFWIIFGISAFLFCIGFFRMGAVIDRYKSKKVERLSGILIIASGIVLNCCGVFAIWKTQSIERGICIATLLLIEAIVMYSVVACRAVTLRFQWFISLIFRVIAVPLGVGGSPPLCIQSSPLFRAQISRSEYVY